jgi:cytidyltransferase-like protein
MIYTISSIAPICNDLRSKNYNLVLATGFFDLLHAEHVNFLKKAKAAGDILIVAVESDARARVIKGEGRPVEPQRTRCQHLLGLGLPAGQNNLPARPGPNGRIVNFVVSLPPDFDNPAAFESLIAAISPNCLAISSHTAHQDKKRSLITKYGGQLKVVHDWNPSVSTTKIING